MLKHTTKIGPILKTKTVLKLAPQKNNKKGWFHMEDIVFKNKTLPTKWASFGPLTAIEVGPQDSVGLGVGVYYN